MVMAPTDRLPRLSRCYDRAGSGKLSIHFVLLSRTMDISAVTLKGRFISLEPMTFAHEQPLIAAAADGELWNTDVTIIPRAEGMRDYIQYALDGLAQGNQLPFVIVAGASDQIVGTTR